MANKKRLIDANALQLKPDPRGGMNGVLMIGRSAGKTMAMVQFALKHMIDNAPTVDAVEVVRCKDCKEWEYDENLSGWCTEWRRRTHGDHFCSYGERMDDNA